MYSKNTFDSVTSPSLWKVVIKFKSKFEFHISTVIWNKDCWITSNYRKYCILKTTNLMLFFVFFVI